MGSEEGANARFCFQSKIGNLKSKICSNPPMSKKRRGARGARKRTPASARRPATRRDPGAAIAAAALVAVFVGAGLLVDSGADSAFDAPKRLMTLLGVGAAALAAFGLSPWGNPFRRAHPDQAVPTARRATVLLLLASLAGALLAALLSPRRPVSLDATRALFLYALLLPIGASRVVEKKSTLLLVSFLLIMAVNALVSILQARGIYQPFPLETHGQREATTAFVGNVGYLALGLALAAVATLGILLTNDRRSFRITAGIGLLLYVAGLLVNQNLTSLSALVAGLVILCLWLFSRRALLPIAGSLLLLAIAIAAYRPMRQRALNTVSAARAGDWNRLVTYRVGPWAAALEMTRARPWVGWGPGTFAAEFVPHRMKAEISLRERLVNPLLASSYSEAHCDYLQPFAEAGIPAGLAVLTAAFLLFRELARLARRATGGLRAEAIFLLAFLAAGAAAALTWFPLQRPISAVPLLLAAGRAWRICGHGTEDAS